MTMYALLITMSLGREKSVTSPCNSISLSKL